MTVMEGREECRDRLAAMTPWEVVIEGQKIADEQWPGKFWSPDEQGAPGTVWDKAMGRARRVDQIGLPRGPRIDDPRFSCMACGLSWDNYMVRHSVWQSAFLREFPQIHETRYLPPGKLCLGCLEDRLGRPLTEDDFPPLPCNRGILFGFMRARSG